MRAGRRLGEALTTLGLRAGDPDADDLALARELARMLVRRADNRHEGWRHLRQALQEAGAEAPWARCEREAVGPAADRVLRDCATPGRTPLVRVQHAVAQELARAVAGYIDPAVVLPRLVKGGPRSVDEEDWERALVDAVNARSKGRAAVLIAQSIAGADG